MPENLLKRNFIISIQLFIFRVHNFFHGREVKIEYSSKETITVTGKGRLLGALRPNNLCFSVPPSRLPYPPPEGRTGRQPLGSAGPCTGQGTSIILINISLAALPLLVLSFHSFLCRMVASFCWICCPLVFFLFFFLFRW